MVSFRKKVLDALDIDKKHVRIPVYSTFLNPSESTDGTNYYNNTDLAVYKDGGAASYKNYAVSRLAKKQVIGPNGQTDRLEVLGFVVGDDPGLAKMLPDCIDRQTETGQTYTGFHHLGGLYDSSNMMIQAMRPSSVMPAQLTTQANYDGNGNLTNTALNHTHKDWPMTIKDQCIKLHEDPYADSLYYHHTKIRFVMTGIDDVSTNTSNLPQASNHRGTVRMLVLRPRTPSVRTRVDGTNSAGDTPETPFILNVGYLPDWDTELFYDRQKQLGGRLGTGITAHDNPHSDVIVSYGLDKRSADAKEIDQDPDSIHFGHYKPTVNPVAHDLTPLDLLMSPINKQKYAVLHDEVFTLDSLHHGAAAQHVANVVIPYNKKVRFAGRMHATGEVTDSDGNVGPNPWLADETFDEPMNLNSRPIVLFLSYNQRVSAQVEGYTVISEV